MAPRQAGGYRLCFLAVKHAWRTDEFWRVAPGENATVRQNVTRPPPRMRWRGPGQATPYRFGGQLPGFSRYCGASRRCQPPALGTGFPVLSRPGVAPGWCPFPAVKVFLLLCQRATQEPALNYFFSFHYPHDVHKKPAVIRIYQRLSTTLCTTNPQVTGRDPGTTITAIAHTIGRSRIPLPVITGGFQRPAEFSASSATYGWPSRQAAICSGRP